MEIKYELNISEKIAADDFDKNVSDNGFIRLLYIEKGNCKIICHEKTFLLNEGEVCAVMPFSDVSLIDASIEFRVAVFAYLLYADIIMPLSAELTIFPENNELSKALGSYFSNAQNASPNKDLLKKSLEYYAIYLSEENISGCEKKLPHKLIPVISYLEKNYDQNFTIADMAKHVNISESGIYKLFTSALNQSPKQYLRNLRMSHAIILLKNTEKSISDIAFETGFYDQFYFSKEFKKEFGVSPATYRKQKTIDKNLI